MLRNLFSRENVIRVLGIEAVCGWKAIEMPGIMILFSAHA